MTRRDFLKASLATVPHLATSSSQANSFIRSAGILTTLRAFAAANELSIAWRPPQPLGVNVVYGNFWNDGTGRVPVLPPDQYAQLSSYSVGFVRTTINIYFIGGGVYTGQIPNADFAVRNILSYRPLASDPTKLEITCIGSTYAIATGESVAFSSPLIYDSVTWRARTPFTVLGGTAGACDTTIDRGRTPYVTGTPSTIVISAGGATLTDTGAVVVNTIAAIQKSSTAVELRGPQLLHVNFFKVGTTPRQQVHLQVAAIDAWLSAGFAVDYGGPHDVLYNFVTNFGLTLLNRIRLQEFAYYAKQNWDPARVLISAQNEIGWSGGVNAAWDLGYGAYFRDTLYPALRAAFQNHTLGFGTGFYDAPAALAGVKWWPNDANTLLTLHGYLDGPGFAAGVPVDGTNAEALEQAMTWIAEHQRRLRVPQIHFGEYGLLSTAADRNSRLSALRRAILAKGWFAAAWGATNPGDQFHVMTRQGAEKQIWLPTADGLGAFGLN